MTGEKGRLGFSARRKEEKKVSACASLIFSTLASSALFQGKNSGSSFATMERAIAKSFGLGIFDHFLSSLNSISFQAMS
jgi:hypothetical protein